MKKSLIKIAHVLMPLGAIVAATACNDKDDMPRPGFSKAEIHATVTTNSGNTPIQVGALTVNDFIVGTQEVNLMFLHENAVQAGVTLENGTLQPNIDTQLGKSSAEPKDLVITSEGAIQKAKIGEGETPNGIYSEMTFKMRKTNDSAGNEAAKGKSMFLAGELEGKPVHIWLESEEMMLVPSKDEEGYTIEGQASLVLTFNVDKIFANVNFDNATDFDKDGVIEIGPNNADANGSIHSVIKSNFAASIEFEKE
jgi:hypothetical protein